MHKTTPRTGSAGVVSSAPVRLNSAAPAGQQRDPEVGTQPTGPALRSVHRFARSHPHLFDGALAAGVFLLAVLSMVAAERMGRASTPPPWVWIVSVLACAALLLRRRQPWAVLAITSVAFLAVQAVTQDVPLLILTVVTALVTITFAGHRRVAIIAAVVITVLAIVIGTLTDDEYFSHPRPLAVAALCALSIAAADGVRIRRAYVAAVEERARRAEESRDQEAQRRVAEERLRIARDLHDMLAHHVAVINVQAGVAGHLLERQPDQAREALDHVREAARSVLSEMQAVVTVLREPGESAVPVEPAPGIDRVGELIDRFRGLGLTIDTVVSGAPVPLPPAVDLVAYRVVQESLTNAGKHAAGGRVEILFDYRPGLLTLRVGNSPGAAPAERASAPGSTGGGFGLIGMRERVGSVGGGLRAGRRPDGGFVVTATLPLHR